jgi:hypothetical protein
LECLLTQTKLAQTATLTLRQRRVVLYVGLGGASPLRRWLNLKPLPARFVDFTSTFDGNQNSFQRWMIAL